VFKISDFSNYEKGGLDDPTWKRAFAQQSEYSMYLDIQQEHIQYTVYGIGNAFLK
jgi:hypothetical protein